MALIVQKYGGTSVGDPKRIATVAERVQRYHRRGDKLVVVVSAMAGETNRLVALAHECNPYPDPRELDVALATGEQVTIALLVMALARIGVKARSFTGWQIPLRTDKAYGRARIEAIDTEALYHTLDDGQVAVVAGFQGVNDDGRITTLGRGGSDTSAVALAAALEADACQIFTDVDGVYTADPRIVPNARRIKRICYDEMLELASLGAKVLQIRSVAFASLYQVPLYVLSTFVADDDNQGTFITKEHERMEKAKIAGVVLNADEAKITVLGVPDRPGIAAEILSPIADENIDVDMIIQNVSEQGLTDFTFTVHRRDYEKAQDVMRALLPTIGAQDVIGDDVIAKVSLVGVGMRTHAGIASKMFRALAEANINIMMISTSEIRVSVVLAAADGQRATQVLHNAFDLGEHNSSD